MTPAFHHSDVPDSPLARWDARWKLTALVITAFGIATLDHLAPSALALAAVLLLLTFARLPGRWVRGRLGLFGFAALPFLVVLPFTLDPAGPGWDLGPVYISEHGIVAGLAVFCRCVAVGGLALILLGTAPLHHTLAAAHKLMVPSLLVLIVGLAYRYAFLLGDEYRRIRVALRTRGFRARANRHGYRTLGHITGAVLVRGADRADRVTAAMRCRGFDGTFRTTITFRTTATDFVSWLLVIAGISAIIVWDRWIIPGSQLNHRLPQLKDKGHYLHPALTAQHLSHRYADGRIALDDVSFTITVGESVALVGPNGAGKTTLFLRLCGVLSGKTGQTSVAGLDPADPGHRKKLPEVVGIVFQNPDDQLFSPTVLDDVAFGPLNAGATPAEAKGRALDALAAVGLPDASDRVPFQLSGGAKRRAALAGVLAMRPSVLLLDEPSAFLDPRGRRDLIGLLPTLPGTKLIATHDLDLVLDVCPRVLVLDGGKLVADGPAETILADPESMARHGLEVPHRLRR